MPNTFLLAFPRQLRYWSLHVTINSAPSFAIACIWLKVYEKPYGIAAMIAAIITFILAYAIITSLLGPLQESTNLLARSIRLGAKIRSWIAVCSLPLTLIPTFAMITPDFWCGWAASMIVSFIFNRNRIDNLTTLDIFATTIVEGLIISVMLLMIAFFTLLILQAKERKKLQGIYHP